MTHEDEYDALARELHEAIAAGQSAALTAKALRILAPNTEYATCHQHGGWHHHGGFQHVGESPLHHPAADHEHRAALGDKP